MEAQQLLTRVRLKRQPVYALFGEEGFLKRLAREKLLNVILGDADQDLAVSVYAGDSLEFPTLRNELDTVPFLTPCRILIVQDADDFVSDHRPALEQYLARPSSVGVLMLELKSFPETTRLAKILPDEAKIACKPLPMSRLPAWCVSWAESRHQKQLDANAAELLVERIGQSLGMLDQELAKIATTIGDRPRITVNDVDSLVSRSKEANLFHILDAIGNGDPGAALSLLEESFADGSDPMGILAPLTFQLRRLATVARLTAAGLSLGPAMDAAGVKDWADVRRNCEKQLRHLGRRRLEKLSDWLAEINLGLKGGNALPERVQVERLIVLLARPRDDVKR
jgi:DNA polymerase-3 subunit delta